ncbi:hypothetical protein [Rubinisphaera sp.]|uniref:hypothetical protein n=1 Tax=Rubinisphaera sp. TaxID=2024857 RepID=UPI000C101E83|nr:hypothetical protein [Rubinisphaera sp.]MBV10269.1 hypothetical protein [Rubinisphaera sp.]HCS53856.1 hypothetical protein [Planctomycetaceae bacterium]|tara:strand:+ start:5097 stop:6236 length:1140 start_codon:yes stop_codon:yes gene_type:complete
MIHFKQIATGMQYIFRLLYPLLWINVLLFPALGVAQTSRCEKQNPVEKKLIEWSAVEPDSRTVRKLANQFELTPFDGFVFRATTRTGEQMMWHIWGDREYVLEEFGQVIDDFQATRFVNSTDRFLRVNVTPGSVDWFNDDAWKIVLHNFQVAAQLAKQTGSIGILFDTEQYNIRLFDSEEMQKVFPHHSQDYRTKLRQRGREWIQAINEAYPDITILMTFGYRAAQKSEIKNFRVGNYELLAPFLDGILSACDERTKIIDGWEYAYGYQRECEFRNARHVMKHQANNWAADGCRYQKHVQASFGLWTDYSLRDYGWDLTEHSKNFHTPLDFESRLRFAMQHSDRYVWVYSGVPNWWTGERLPTEYIDALTNAKTAAQVE